MNISKFLAKVIGLYEIIISTAMLMNMSRFADGIHSLNNNKSLMLYIGCMTVILGLLMVVSHSIWEWSWRVAVTLVAWIALAKGICILLFPQAMDDVTIQFVNNINLAYTIACINLVFGALLCYFGFRQR